MADGNWVDLGTGYCAGVYDEETDRALLIAKHESACSSLPITPSDFDLELDVDEGSVPDQQGQQPLSKSSGVDESTGEVKEGVWAIDPRSARTNGVQPQPVQPGTPEDWEHQYILVVSHDFSKEDVLLFSALLKDDVYKQQQDTLIVWTEPSGQEMALSFQEQSGCHEIWDFLVEVQKHIRIADAEVEETPSPHPDTSSEGIHPREVLALAEKIFGLPLSEGTDILPPPSLDNLRDIEYRLYNARQRLVACGSSDDAGGLALLNNAVFGNAWSLGIGPAQGARIGSVFRDQFSDSMVKSQYLASLATVFYQAEQQERLPALHLLCTITQHILLLGDQRLYEHVVSKVWEVVLGLLEYDPEFPRSKASWRTYLSQGTTFKEVVPITNEAIRNKIQYTYRLTFLREVILTRILPDSLSNLLSSMTYCWQMDIVSWCLTDNQFLHKLFGIFSPKSMEEMKAKAAQGIKEQADGVLFLQALCNIGKSMALGNRVQMCAQLVQRGLLDVIAFGLGIGLDLPPSESVATGSTESALATARPGHQDHVDSTQAQKELTIPMDYDAAQSHELGTSTPSTVHRDSSSTFSSSSDVGLKAASATALSPRYSPGTQHAPNSNSIAPDETHDLTPDEAPEEPEELDPDTQAKVRNAAADMLLMLLDLDAPAVRQYIVQRRQLRSMAVASQIGRLPRKPKHTYGRPRRTQLYVSDKKVEPPRGNDLVEVICTLLHRGDGLGIRSQMTETLRSLLDPASDMGLRSMGQEDAGRATLLNLFYAQDAHTLFAPLRQLPPLTSLCSTKSHAPSESAQSSPKKASNTYRSLGPTTLDTSVLYVNLCDLLTYMIGAHKERAESFVLSTNLGVHLGSLLLSKDRPLVAAAMRVVKACVLRDSRTLHRYILVTDVLDAMLFSLLSDLHSGRRGVVTSTAINLFDTLTSDETLASSVAQLYAIPLASLAQDARMGGVFSTLIAIKDQPNGLSSSPLLGSSPGKSNGTTNNRMAFPVAKTRGNLAWINVKEEDDPMDLSDDESTPSIPLQRGKKRKRLMTSSTVQVHAKARGHARTPSQSVMVGRSRPASAATTLAFQDQASLVPYGDEDEVDELDDRSSSGSIRNGESQAQDSKFALESDEEDEDYGTDLSALGTRNLKRPNVLVRSNQAQLDANTTPRQVRRRSESNPPRPSPEVLAAAAAGPLAPSVPDDVDAERPTVEARVSEELGSKPGCERTEPASAPTPNHALELSSNLAHEGHDRKPDQTVDTPTTPGHQAIAQPVPIDHRTFELASTSSLPHPTATEGPTSGLP